MNITRSAALWSLVFLTSGFYLGGTQLASAQSQPGWGEIWQQRMTIGQAQLDDAFKLAESGRVDEALAVIDQVIATDPNNWRSYFLKSAVLVLARRGVEALKEIDTSINLASKGNVSPGLLAELYESKARSCMDYGRYDEAKKSLEQAVRLANEGLQLRRNFVRQPPCITNANGLEARSQHLERAQTYQHLDPRRRDQQRG